MKPSTKSTKKRNMVKGIQRAAAVMLLEAMVLLAFGTLWAGSWTQKICGTGAADVWEICGNDPAVTRTAWLQGWRVLGPLCCAEFNASSFQETINDNLAERSPRLVVAEAPHKVWNSAWVLNRSDSNAKKQKLKRIRKAVHPFFDTACHIAREQVDGGRDFILQRPLALSSFPHDSEFGQSRKYKCLCCKSS